MSNQYLSTKPVQQQTQQQTKPAQSKPQQQKPTEQQKPTGGDYMGYGSYDAMIEAFHKEAPDVPIEVLKRANPDPAEFKLGGTTEYDAQMGLLG